eukprot:2588674-Rhodomonas_salina.2
MRCPVLAWRVVLVAYQPTRALRGAGLCCYAVLGTDTGYAARAVWQWTEANTLQQVTCALGSYARAV